MLECLILRLQDVVEEKLTRACGTDWEGVKLCGDNDVAEAARSSAARARLCRRSTRGMRCCKVDGPGLLSRARWRGSIENWGKTGGDGEIVRE